MATSAKTAASTASNAAAEKRARQRLSVLELAQTLGSVSVACRQRGVSRTQFYEYKKRFQEHGLLGLKDLLKTCRRSTRPIRRLPHPQSSSGYWR